MLVVVTIKAQEFPVATVGGIIVVVVILVMNGKFAQFFAAQFAGTTAADMGEKLQGLFAVSCLAQPMIITHGFQSLFKFFGA